MRRRFGIISSMKKRTREKVALLVFALLVVLGGSVLLRYFETGRSFNMAATAVAARDLTHVHDIICPEGYLVIILTSLIHEESNLST